jgi:hypothetical protein
LQRQAEKKPVTVQAPIDFVNERRTPVDRLSVKRFVERNRAMIIFQHTRFIEKERHEVSEEYIKRYFEAPTIHLQNLPSFFVWNADERRVGKRKNQEAPDATVSATAKSGTVTIVEERDDGQLTVLTAISASGNSIPPLFITRNKPFEQGPSQREQLYNGHAYFIRNAEKTFITDILFLN